MVLGTRTGRGAECRSQQLVNDVVNPALGDRLGDTSPQVGFKDVPTDPIQTTLHGCNLMKDINAITVLFHHADHTIEMAPRRTEPEPHRVDVSSHQRPSKTRRRST